MKYDITSEGQKVRIYERLQGIALLVKVLIGLMLVLIIVTIAGFIISFGNDAVIMTMQTDTLDQVMEVRQTEPVEDEPAQAEPTSTLTPDDFDLVCRVVASEARGEDLIGQEAVAQVIRDRSTAWQQSITEVCTAEGQFAEPYTEEINDSVKLAVANVFSGLNVLEVPTTHFAQGEPYWAENKVDRGAIGVHRFWY